VRSSILGADRKSSMTFAKQHGQCDDYLRESSVPYVIIRPNYFQQNVTEQAIPPIGPDGKMYVPAGKSRISMSDTRDVASVAYRALTARGHAGHVYEVTGPAALSHQEVAELVSQVMGRQIRYVSPPLEVFRKTLAGYGLDAWMVAGLSELYEDYQRSGADGYAAQVTETVREVTGKMPRSLAGLLAEWSATSVPVNKTVIKQPVGSKGRA